MQSITPTVRKNQNRLARDIDAFINGGGKIEILPNNCTAFDEGIQLKPHTQLQSNEEKITKIDCIRIRATLRDAGKRNRSNAVRKLANEFKVSTKVIRAIDSGEFKVGS